MCIFFKQDKVAVLLTVEIVDKNHRIEFNHLNSLIDSFLFKNLIQINLHQIYLAFYYFKLVQFKIYLYDYVNLIILYSNTLIYNFQIFLNFFVLLLNYFLFFDLSSFFFIGYLFLSDGLSDLSFFLGF